MKYRQIVLVSIVALLFADKSIGQESASPFEDKMLAVMFQPDVQADLELSDEQKSEITTLLDEVKQRRNELSKQLREFHASGAAPAELEAKRMQFVDRFEIDKSEMQAKMMNVLLPHQQQRLRQTTTQLMIRETAKQQKIPTGILAPEIRELLDIDDEQANRIEKKAAKLQKELTEKIKKLQEEARSELMSELSAVQREKYQSLVGDPIQRGDN